MLAKHLEMPTEDRLFWGELLAEESTRPYQIWSTLLEQT